jgi:UDP-N-acetylmuramate dehydrogenase
MHKEAVMEGIIRKLTEANIGIVKENELLANHTTMKIGGPADILIEPKNIECINETIHILLQNEVKWRAIGRGSNLLVSDKGIEGVVIKLGAGLSHLDVNGEDVTVGAGFSMISLATRISRKGLTGLEFASGIPGSVGGAVYMNAGAHGSDISKILTKAHILFDNGALAWLSNEEMGYSYRTSTLQKKRPGICLEAVFSLHSGNRDEIIKNMQSHKEYRRNTQPWNLPCAGSIFRNPLPNHAGQLIEKAGLKGFQIGGAKVSDMHGNFIVNAGNATSQDVLNLISHIKNTIYQLYSIEMETEVEILGRK